LNFSKSGNSSINLEPLNSFIVLPGLENNVPQLKLETESTKALQDAKNLANNPLVNLLSGGVFSSSTAIEFINKFIRNEGGSFNNPPGVIEQVKQTNQFKQFQSQAINHLEEYLKINSQGTPSDLVRRPNSFRFNPLPLDEYPLFFAYGGTRGTSASFSDSISQKVDVDGDGDTDIRYSANITYLIKDRFEIDPGDLFGDKFFDYMMTLQNQGLAKPFDTNISFTIPVSGTITNTPSSNSSSSSSSGYNT